MIAVIQKTGGGRGRTLTGSARRSRSWRSRAAIRIPRHSAAVPRLKIKEVCRYHRTAHLRPQGAPRYGAAYAFPTTPWSGLSAAWPAGNRVPVRLSNRFRLVETLLTFGFLLLASRLIDLSLRQPRRVIAKLPVYESATPGPASRTDRQFPGDTRDPAGVLQDSLKDTRVLLAGGPVRGTLPDGAPGKQAVSVDPGFVSPGFTRGIDHAAAQGGSPATAGRSSRGEPGGLDLFPPVAGPDWPKTPLLRDLTHHRPPRAGLPSAGRSPPRDWRSGPAGR